MLNPKLKISDSNIFKIRDKKKARRGGFEEIHNLKGLEILFAFYQELFIEDQDVFIEIINQIDISNLRSITDEEFLEKINKYASSPEIIERSSKLDEALGLDISSFNIESFNRLTLESYSKKQYLILNISEDKLLKSLGKKPTVEEYEKLMDSLDRLSGTSFSFPIKDTWNIKLINFMKSEDVLTISINPLTIYMMS